MTLPSLHSVAQEMTKGLHWACAETGGLTGRLASPNMQGR